MKKKLIYAIVAIAVIALIVAVRGGKKDKQEETVKDAGKAVEVLTAQTTSDERYISVTGMLTAKFSADVRAEIGGVVRKVLVSDWVHVKKGQLLAMIDTSELKASVKRAEASVKTAKAQYLEAEAYQNRALRELERVKKLKASGLATQQQLDDAGTDAEAASAKTGSAQAQINAAQEDLNQLNIKLSKMEITAPISGTVSVRNANVGDMAGGDNNPPLFRIIDESIYDLNVQVPTVDIASVHVDSKVDFTVDAYPDRVFTGKVAFINPQVNSDDKAVSVNIIVLNTDSLLKDGYFVKAKIYTGQFVNSVILPQTALLGIDVVGHKAKVFVVEDNKAVLKEVSTGDAVDGNMQVLSGLKDKEQVIFRGGFTIKNGDTVSVTSAADK